MADPPVVLARRAPLSATERQWPAVFVRTLPTATRFALRIDPGGLPAGGRAAGFALDLAVNRCARTGGRGAMRLGPDEWLLCGPESEAGAVGRELQAALTGRHCALVDVSHRYVALQVGGAGAAPVLNSGCPLDLDEGAFPAGSATRTLLAKAEVLLARWTGEADFEILCARSYAGYVRDFLFEAAASEQA